MAKLGEMLPNLQKDASEVLPEKANDGSQEQPFVIWNIKKARKEQQFLLLILILD